MFSQLNHSSFSDSKTFFILTKFIGLIANPCCLAVLVTVTWKQRAPFMTPSHQIDLSLEITSSSKRKWVTKNETIF